MTANPWDLVEPQAKVIEFPSGRRVPRGDLVCTCDHTATMHVEKRGYSDDEAHVFLMCAGIACRCADFTAPLGTIIREAREGSALAALEPDRTP